MTLSQTLHELHTLRQVLPADAPVRAWLLSPAAGVPDLAVLEVCGVTGGVDRLTGRLCATLQLRLPPAAVRATTNDAPAAPATAQAGTPGASAAATAFSAATSAAVAEAAAPGEAGKEARAASMTPFTHPAAGAVTPGGTAVAGAAPGAGVNDAGVPVAPVAAPGSAPQGWEGGAW